MRSFPKKINKDIDVPEIFPKRKCPNGGVTPAIFRIDKYKY